LPTFDEAAGDVIADYEVNGKRSLRDVKMRITRHLKPYFGGRRMASITMSDGRQYVLQRLAPLRVQIRAETSPRAHGRIALDRLASSRH
jgi:hypothetical protein